MIVPMMKLSLLIFYKEYQTFLGELREKGMVHIHENTERTAEDTDLQAKLMLIRRTGEMITHMQSRNDVEQVEKVKVMTSICWIIWKVCIVGRIRSSNNWQVWRRTMRLIVLGENFPGR